MRRAYRCRPALSVTSKVSLLVPTSLSFSWLFFSRCGRRCTRGCRRWDVPSRGSRSPSPRGQRARYTNATSSPQLVRRSACRHRVGDQPLTRCGQHGVVTLLKAKATTRAPAARGVANCTCFRGWRCTTFHGRLGFGPQHVISAGRDWPASPDGNLVRHHPVVVKGGRLAVRRVGAVRDGGVAFLSSCV